MNEKRRQIQSGQARMKAVPAVLQRMNVREVLETMRSLGPCSRADLRRVTGISAPTLSKLTDWLEQAGLIELEHVRITAPGRPGKVFRLSTVSCQVFGVVVDVKQCAVISAGLDGVLHPDRAMTFATPGAYRDLLAEIERAVEILRKRSEATCLGIGLSMPGLVSVRTDEVVFSPNLHFIDGHAPARDLAQHTGLTTVMLQEEQAFCLAEQRFGAARDMQDFAMIDVSAGLGMGVVSGGQFVGGYSGFGGELGHITVAIGGAPCGCGNRGCLETVASDTAVLRELAQLSGRTLTMDEALTAVGAGQLNADAVVAHAIEYLATGIGVVINLFNPEGIFIYGRMFDLADNAFAMLTAKVAQRSVRPSYAQCRILRTHGNKQLGAVAAFINHHFATIGPRIGG